jgi:anion-transporting  ArsA/GET3 family ATPase
VNETHDDAAGGDVVDDVDDLSLLTAPRVVIVAGKGGVGKTTVTAVVARAAARRGDRVLVVELDQKPALRDWLAGAVGIEVRTISPGDALDEYLRAQGFARIAKRLSRTGVIEVVGTAAPGIDDLVVLGRIKQLERSGEFDLIVVDGPAAGHALTMLTAATGLGDSVDSGPVRAQADEVRAMLSDPERCQVVLVAVPEATPINEVIETAYALEERVGIQLGPIVVNLAQLSDSKRARSLADFTAAIDEALTAERLTGTEAVELRQVAAFSAARAASQDRELQRLRSELALPVVVLPALPVAGVDAAAIDRLADLVAQTESKAS